MMKMLILGNGQPIGRLLFIALTFILARIFTSCSSSTINFNVHIRVWPSTWLKNLNSQPESENDEGFLSAIIGFRLFF